MWTPQLPQSCFCSWAASCGCLWGDRSYNLLYHHLDDITPTVCFLLSHFTKKSMEVVISRCSIGCWQLKPVCTPPSLLASLQCVAQGKTINSSESHVPSFYWGLSAKWRPEWNLLSEFSWDLNEVHMKHSAQRLAHSRNSQWGQYCYLYCDLFLSLWLFIVKYYVSGLSNIWFFTLQWRTWSIKRSIEASAWLALKKRHDHKVVWKLPPGLLHVWASFLLCQTLL